MILKLIDFLDNSPVNFLAVKEIKRQLVAAGYTEIDTTKAMPRVKAGDKLFATKNDSSIFAFHIGNEALAEKGFHVISAHCDSPTFRIKPNAEMVDGDGSIRLNVETYGGSILSTWFDRPLSLAGRVILRGTDALHPISQTLFIKRPLLVIPNLAIHFNRQVNDGVKLSKQKDTLPILGFITDKLEKGNILVNLIASELHIDKQDILDFDLYLYDTTPAQIVGLNEEFICSGRLDDLSMVHAGLEALLSIQETPGTTKVLAVFDNEETGSQTKQGAGSPFLAHLLERINLAQGGTQDGYYRAVEQAFMISADNGHAYHPNYAEKFDPTNHPRMGGGPVIKLNAAQKYLSDAASAAVFAEICRQAGVPCQTFVNHSDVAGGSTLGNILSASLPIKGVDMGALVWAMHSAHETASVQDHTSCIRAFQEFFRQ